MQYRKSRSVIVAATALSVICSIGLGQQKKNPRGKTQTSPRIELPTDINIPITGLLKLPEDALPKGDTLVISTGRGDVAVRKFFKGHYDENISGDDVCKLDAQLSVLKGVDRRTDRGADYGLNFCLDGVPFESASSNQSVVAPAAPRKSEVARGPAVYTEQGACPFECCTYREWWANTSTPVLASANTNARQVRMLKTGERVRAVTGFVRTRGVEFLVTRNNGRYHRGDTIWVYSYRGEGFFTVWFKGKMYGEELGFSPYGGTGGSRCQDDSRYCWGTLKTELQSEWWIKLRLRDGRIGWTNRGEDFDNKDACS